MDTVFELVLKELERPEVDLPGKFREAVLGEKPVGFLSLYLRCIHRVMERMEQELREFYRRYTDQFKGRSEDFITQSEVDEYLKAEAVQKHRLASAIRLFTDSTVEEFPQLIGRELNLVVRARWQLFERPAPKRTGALRGPRRPFSRCHAAGPF